MIKIEYNDESISVEDINVYLKMSNYSNESVNTKDINVYLKMGNYNDEFISVEDINIYLKMEMNYDDINYIYQTYDQFHPEYRRIIELFNFGLGL